jgi:hypothetical protein
MLAGDQRAEDPGGGHGDGDEETELGNYHPQPAARNEITPALPQLVQHPGPGRRRHRGQPHPQAQQSR